MSSFLSDVESDLSDIESYIPNKPPLDNVFNQFNTHLSSQLANHQGHQFNRQSSPIQLDSSPSKANQINRFDIKNIIDISTGDSESNNISNKSKKTPASIQISDDDNDELSEDSDDYRLLEEILKRPSPNKILHDNKYNTSFKEKSAEIESADEDFEIVHKIQKYSVGPSEETEKELTPYTEYSNNRIEIENESHNNDENNDKRYTFSDDEFDCEIDCDQDQGDKDNGEIEPKFEQTVESNDNLVPTNNDDKFEETKFTQINSSYSESSTSPINSNEESETTLNTTEESPNYSVSIKGSSVSISKKRTFSEIEDYNEEIISEIDKTKKCEKSYKRQNTGVTLSKKQLALITGASFLVGIFGSLGGLAYYGSTLV